MNQQCKVCGEAAAGFHFGAFTCEGCKSFFGRTYNNLSSISECKNGGQCVINKKNRTSCKACRLRKCLVVGMSKSGSRYGRRSNWFKIHCLLQEQQQHQSNQQFHLQNNYMPANKLPRLDKTGSVDELRSTPESVVSSLDDETNQFFRNINPSPSPKLIIHDDKNMLTPSASPALFQRLYYASAFSAFKPNFSPIPTPISSGISPISTTGTLSSLDTLRFLGGRSVDLLNIPALAGVTAEDQQDEPVDLSVKKIQVKTEVVVDENVSAASTAPLDLTKQEIHV